MCTIINNQQFTTQNDQPCDCEAQLALEGSGEDEWAHDHSLEAGLFFFPVLSMEFAGLDEVAATEPFLYLNLIVFGEGKSCGL